MRYSRATTTLNSRKHFAKRDLKRNFVATPLRLTCLSTSERALYFVYNSHITKLNLLLANVMENGYANIAEFSSARLFPCTYTRVQMLLLSSERASKII